MTWLDLLLFTGATYGASWTLTRSKLMDLPRRVVKPVPFFGPLSRCVACMSAWIGLGLSLALRCGGSGLFSPGFQPETVTDHAVLMCWSVAASWILGLKLGDAD
jgi:hypothetical protein